MSVEKKQHDERFFIEYTFHSEKARQEKVGRALIALERSLRLAAVKNAGHPRLFVGTFHHALDSKKRVVIPAVWRKTGAPDRHVLIEPDAQHPVLRAHIVSAQFEPPVAPHALLGWDDQGRIRIPDHLLAHARIVSPVILESNMSGFTIRADDGRPPKSLDELSPDARAAMKDVGL